MTAKIWLQAALSAALLGWTGVATPDAAQAQGFLLGSQAEVALSGALLGWAQAQNSVVRSETESTVGAIANETRQAVQPHNQGGVIFASGGVGNEGKAAMRAVESGYNLRLLFAVEGSGAYLAGVHVRLVDHGGNTLVDTVAEGPYFFANVRPGKYEIVAESQGRTLTRSVEVSPTGAISRALYWQDAG